jgi:hypothetical protein
LEEAKEQMARLALISLRRVFHPFAGLWRHCKTNPSKTNPSKTNPSILGRNIMTKFAQ